jgi:DNA repair photolyase
LGFLNRSGRILALHNPYQSRNLHGCRLRLVVNTYVGCPNRCVYCYITSYTKISDINNPRRKKDFRTRLERDVKEYLAQGYPKYPVYLSSNCDAFESGLEERYGDALCSLKVLRDANFPILIMTKNPSMLLKPDYSDAINNSRTVIQTTVPFVDSRFEPYAPAPQLRLRAVAELVERGFKAVVRLDPLVPSSGHVEGQSEEEINRLVEQARNTGVRHIVSKCLRLSIGIKKLYPDFYDQLKPYYRVHGQRESRSVWVLRQDVKEKLLTLVYEACKRTDVALFTCMDHVSFSKTRCDGTEEILATSSVRLDESSYQLSSSLGFVDDR